MCIFHPIAKMTPMGCKFETLPASSDPELINPTYFLSQRLLQTRDLGPRR